jgi:hypothetical protein
VRYLQLRQCSVRQFPRLIDTQMQRCECCRSSRTGTTSRQSLASASDMRSLRHTQQRTQLEDIPAPRPRTVNRSLPIRIAFAYGLNQVDLPQPFGLRIAMSSPRYEG